jgi:pyruvate kinase
MAKTYTEKELQTILEKNGSDITVGELNKSKVYIFRISKKNMSLDQKHSLAVNLKNMLDKIGLKSIILLDDIIQVTELERGKDND